LAVTGAGRLLLLGRVDADEWPGESWTPWMGGLTAHCDSSSMGKGKMMVEFFSALIELRVWR
jgi:hypothetical protein